MINFQELEGQVAELTTAAEESGIAERNAYADWVIAQGANIRSFLLDQARLTALDQSHVTEKAVDNIPALQIAIGELADTATSAFRADFSTYVPPQRTHESRSELAGRFQEFADRVTEEFSALMRGVGYDGGSGHRGGHPGNRQPTWFFYRPGQTARVARFDVASGEMDSYVNALNHTGDVKRRLQKANDDLSRVRAAAIWGA